jgi:hypothetical protein
MTIRSKKTHPPEEIKQLLQAKINPGEIKVGVATLKSLNDSVIVETNCMEETEALEREIELKCGRFRTTYSQTKKTPHHTHKRAGRHPHN